MRCHAEVPISRPDDAAWQQAWQTLVAPLATSPLRPDGLVDIAESPPIRLVGGTHLASGATYRIAEDRLRSGTLEMVVGHPDRDLRFTWSPHNAPGRAEAVVRSLDQLVEVRASSGLNHLGGDLRFALQSDDLLRLRLRLDWLAVDFTARVSADPTGDRLVGDLAVHGAGLWRPTLAPLLAAVRGKVARAFPDAMQDLARSLEQAPELEPVDAPPDLPFAGSPLMSPAEADAQIRRGFEEVGRRLRSIATTVSALPWWRRTAHRWRLESAALPRGTWPADDVLGGGTWVEVEREALTRLLQTVPWRRQDHLDTVVRELTDKRLELRRQWDQYLSTVVPEPAPPPQPVLTDENLDTRWLATPWSTIRRLGGMQSDAEAERSVTEAVSNLTAR